MKLVEVSSNNHYGFANPYQIKDECTGRVICIHGTHDKEHKISFISPLTIAEMNELTAFINKSVDKRSRSNFGIA